MKQSLIVPALLSWLISPACTQQRNSTTVQASPSQPVSGTIGPSGPILSYANTVDRVAPAVVTVHSSRRTKVPEQFPFSNDPFFQWFFGRSGNPQSFGNPPQPQEEIEKALGSGVIVRSDGHILTNEHVIDGAQQISVDLPDRRTFNAKLIGSDSPSDLAVLKIDASNLPVLSLADSDQVHVGDVCLAVGNPFGLGETVTAGIVSAKSRETGISSGSFQDFLQTDAPINQGNSGGALVNTAGSLIGINSQIISTTGGNVGIGFAIPSNMAKNVMGQLISKGKVTRGFLGVTVQYLNSALASSLGMKEVQGVLVSRVEPGGPADHAGLKQGDVILNLNGESINDVNALRNKVAELSPGTSVTLTILRNGNQQQLHATLGEFNAQRAASSAPASATQQLGITVEPVTPDLAAQLGLPARTKGLAVVGVNPTGVAAQAGIQPGDVIQQINHQPVTSANDIASALQKSGTRPALLLINRNGQTLYLAVPAH